MPGAVGAPGTRQKPLDYLTWLPLERNTHLAHIHIHICAYAYTIHTHTHTGRCNSRISFQSVFFFVLSDTTLRSHTHSHSISPFPFPFPFHSIIIYCGSKCWLQFEKWTKRNETTPATSKSKAQLPKTLASVCFCYLFCVCFHFFFFFWIRWTNFLLFALSLFLLLLRLQNV